MELGETQVPEEHNGVRERMSMHFSVLASGSTGKCYM